MAKIGQPMIYKTLHGKLKIEQHEPSTWVQSLSFIYIGQPPNTVVITPTIAPIIQTPQVVNTGNNFYLLTICNNNCYFVGPEN
jgi:hypothetical protein